MKAKRKVRAKRRRKNTTVANPVSNPTGYTTRVKSDKGFAEYRGIATYDAALKKGRDLCEDLGPTAKVQIFEHHGSGARRRRANW